MKKLLPLIMILCLMLTACSDKKEEETTLAAGDETTAAQADAIYTNPLNGEKLTEPYNGRVFAVTINNVSPALPHRGLNDADVYFEMFVNDYCTRGLALFSDIKAVPSVGSIRSTRYNFTDISQAYDAVLFHANCSGEVYDDMVAAGIDNLMADVPIGYRDDARNAGGYAWEHTLFATGENLYNAASDKGFRLTNPDKTYGLAFADEGTPANGAPADEIEIIFTINSVTKTSIMKYDATADKYTYWQYGKEMTDENTGTPEQFKNVIVILAPTENKGVYHVADLLGSGDGFFACGGQIISVKWSRQAETDAFSFTLADGSALALETGSTYIAIAPTGSQVIAE